MVSLKNPLQRIAFLIVSVLFSVWATWNIVNKDFAKNESSMIYSAPHLLTELIILIGSLFLIIEAGAHIKSSSTMDIKRNLNRYVRIFIGVSIITLHATVLIYGGY